MHLVIARKHMISHQSIPIPSNAKKHQKGILQKTIPTQSVTPIPGPRAVTTSIVIRLSLVKIFPTAAVQEKHATLRRTREPKSPYSKGKMNCQILQSFFFLISYVVYIKKRKAPLSTQETYEPTKKTPIITLWLSAILFVKPALFHFHRYTFHIAPWKWIMVSEINNHQVFLTGVSRNFRRSSWSSWSGNISLYGKPPQVSYVWK